MEFPKLTHLTLTDIFNIYGGDKGSYFTHVGTTNNIAHYYTRIYELYMEKFRDEEINMLEIGLWCSYFPGSSIKGWNSYFNKVQYYGIDIVDCTQFNNDSVHISICDQTSEEMLGEYIKDKPKFKFIIDDGIHEEEAIIKSLGSLFPQLESKGIYFIEDLHVVNRTNLYKLCDKTFESSFISEDKIAYINENVENCYFSQDHKLCVIIKK